MMFRKLKHKLLFSAVAISLLVALACMLAVSWVVSQQHLNQSHALLGKASRIIEADLLERNAKLLAAARQLATQKNMGSTIWYLSKYARSGVDQETLFNTYGGLAKDIYEIGRVAEASSVVIYDSEGRLVTFATFDAQERHVGFVQSNASPMLRYTTLRDSEELAGKFPTLSKTLEGVDLEYGTTLPSTVSKHYVQRRNSVEGECIVPIMDDAYDVLAGRLRTRQVGVVVMRQALDIRLVRRLSELTDTSINIFTRDGLSVGELPSYRQLDRARKQLTVTPPLVVPQTFNEIVVAGVAYYQILLPLYFEQQEVGVLAMLYSQAVAQKNIVQMLDSLALIALGSLVLIFPFAWYAAVSISKPLTLLIGIFRSVASGKQSGALSDELAKLNKERQRDDELGELTQSFVAMNDAINQQIAQINEINTSLEAKVNERTVALVAREQETRTLIENSPDTVARYDAACRRIYVNPAFAAQVEGGIMALLGKTPNEFPGGENSKIYEDKIREVFASGQDTQFELRWSGKSGRDTYTHIRLTAERDVAGSIISVLGVGRDITELNESRNELGRKELAKTRFLAAAGHDLRQPLAAANLFIDTLKITAPTQRQSEVIECLDQAMHTFNVLLDALLDISKLDAGRVQPECAPIDVTQLFIWLEQNFEPLAREKQIGFKLHFPLKETLFVNSDLGLIKSVLMNFVSNAIKFTPHGAVLVSARRRGEMVLFQIWDTGIGIKTEDLKYIFDEFYQINNPQRDRNSGLGLGLAIAKRALNLLGVKIVCHSRVGRGSVFEFQLPIVATRPEQGSPNAANELPEPIGVRAFIQGKNFAVVEDDKLVAQAITSLIEGAGGSVVCFHRAEDALRQIDGFATHYYIVDYMLGSSLNGIELLKQLRQKIGRPINAVLVTGDTSAAFINDAAEFPWPVLHKPVDIKKLIAALERQT